MNQKVDYVSLIKNSPLNLTTSSEAKFTKMLQQNFSQNDLQYFVANLYCKNRYSNDEYPIDLDSVWKFIGYSTKRNAKYAIEHNFIMDQDYKFDDLCDTKESSSIEEEVFIHTEKTLGGAGLNKETILLKIDTFKHLCMLAKTNRGAEIRGYFLKLENVLTKVINEERKQFAIDTAKKDKIIAQIPHNVALQKQDLLREFGVKTHLIYIMMVAEIDTNSYIIRIGETRMGLFTRYKSHCSSYKPFKVILLDCFLAEKFCRNKKTCYFILGLFIISYKYNVYCLN